jgi:glycosyltransferase involved in cell wall biosynthesis
MKVLQLVHGFGLGGTERQLLLLVRLLRDTPDLVVDVGALRLDGPLLRELADREVRAFELPVRSTYGASFWRQAAKLRRRLRSDGVDLVHSHDVYSNWLSLAATRGTRTRSLVSQRNLREPDRPALRLLQRLEVRFADHVLVNAPAIARRLCSRGVDRRRISVVPNAVELRDLASRQTARSALIAELGLDASAAVVGVVASFRSVKDHDLLIDAVERCRRELPMVCFVLVGDGEERARIERRVAALGLTSVVRFLGARLDGPELAAAFDLAVLCSREEGLPNALLEAMAAGTPVLATPVGGVGDLIEDRVTGFLVKERTPSALAAGVLNALDGGGARRRIAERARDLVLRDYGAERLRGDILALYRALASSEGRSRRSSIAPNVSSSSRGSVGPPSSPMESLS